MQFAKESRRSLPHLAKRLLEAKRAIGDTAFVSGPTMTLTLGRCRTDEIIRPISGRALELPRYEVLRITQIEGQQCVDLNCLNLHDYKERMSVRHMRAQAQ